MATAEDGVLRPDTRLLPPLDARPSPNEPLAACCEESEAGRGTASIEIDRIWAEIDVDSGAPPPTRD
jgi:hypothetical protein